MGCQPREGHRHPAKMRAKQLYKKMGDLGPDDAEPLSSSSALGLFH